MRTKILKVPKILLTTGKGWLFVSAMLLTAGCSENGLFGGGDGGIAQELQGRWESNCISSETIGNMERSQLIIDQQSITQVMGISVSGQCRVIEAEVIQEGTYSRQHDNGSGIFAIDRTVTRTRVKPVTKDGVDMLNLGVLCGYDNWELNQEKDVTDRTGSDRCLPKAPATYYNVYSLDGNKLYFGREASVATPTSRPLEVNRERVFTKL